MPEDTSRGDVQPLAFVFLVQSSVETVDGAALALLWKFLRHPHCCEYIYLSGHSQVKH